MCDTPPALGPAGGVLGKGLGVTMHNTETALSIAQNLGATFTCTAQIASLADDMGRPGIGRIMTTTRAANEAAIRTAAAARGFIATFAQEEPGWIRVDLVKAAN